MNKGAEKAILHYVKHGMWPVFQGRFVVVAERLLRAAALQLVEKSRAARKRRAAAAKRVREYGPSPRERAIIRKRPYGPKSSKWKMGFRPDRPYHHPGPKAKKRGSR